MFYKFELTIFKNKNMLKLLLVFTFTIISVLSYAQIKAVTENGDEVILQINGTWKYKEDSKNNDSIKINAINFNKPADANFLLKSKRCNSGFWLNPKKWIFEKSTDNTSEYSFSLKENGSVMAMAITESVSMDLPYLRKFAIDNMQQASSSFQIVNEEYRQVNGLKVFLLETNATVQGISFRYLNYYYSDTASTVQFLCFTSSNLYAKYKNELESMLNGFVTLNKNDSTESYQVNKNTVKSLLVANSNCKAMFIGKWSYVANGKKYIDMFRGDTVLEYSGDYKYKSEYSLRWISNCSYELKLQKTNDPSAKLIQFGRPITVDIIEIDSNQMRYQMRYGDGNFSGVMAKEK